MKRSATTLLAAITLVAACGATEPELAGYTREPPPDVSAITLPDVSAGGADFALEAPADHLLLVYFGYTSCPDVCPTTLSDVRAALEDLGDDADRLVLAMATVDPERDTDEVLTGYVQSFVAGAHALRTKDDASLRAAADALGAAYDVGLDDEGNYEVVHTGHLYVIDDAGLLRLTWPFGVEQAAIVEDLRILLERA